MMQTISQYFENRRKKQAAMTVVMSDEKVLILRRSDNEKWMPDRWNLPGGGVEEGETPKQAARRECKEEAGILLHGLTLAKRVEKPNIILWVFHAKIGQEDVLLDPRESSDYAWVGKEQIHNYLFVPDCKDFIQQALGAR